MALHVLMIAYVPNVRDADRMMFNEALLFSGWNQYTIPFTWTKEFSTDAFSELSAPAQRAQVERATFDELQAALDSAGSPTCNMMLQIGGAPAVEDSF